jgi:hypothetical protein
MRHISPVSGPAFESGFHDRRARRSGAGLKAFVERCAPPGPKAKGFFQSMGMSTSVPPWSTVSMRLNAVLKTLI